MRRVIVGTAGHIDHCKTKLVEALTGINCDRWVEEKERGITIDLGFAFMRQDDLQIGFIDVPGHERFVHNALAGLGGIRIALLVIAADEGVKQQTREHLEICNLLEIPACLVALTKSDLVNDELIELARLEVDELLAETRYSAAPVLPVSSKTGDGVDELRTVLLQLAERWNTESDVQRPARIPIDRAFHLKGLGVVVTGTLVSGVVSSGDTLQVLPGDARARIRNVQVHGESRPRAETGERTALQLSGVDLSQLHRGVQLAAANSLERTTSLLGSFDLLDSAPKPLKGSTLVRFHLYASEVQGRIRPLSGPIFPGQSGPVEIRLLQPVAAVRGDRFIARRPSPPSTLGGGKILDPQWHRHRGAVQQQALSALGGDAKAVLEFWVREATEGGISAEDLAHRLGAEIKGVESDLEELAANQRLIRVPTGAGHPVRWITPDTFQGIGRRAEKVLGEYFRSQRLAQGMPKAEAVDRILPGRAAQLSEAYLEWLEAQKILQVDGNTINLPGRKAQLTDEESTLAQEIRTAFTNAGLQPPSPKQVQESLHAKPQIFDGVVSFLLDRGDLVHLPGGLLISSAALESVIDGLRSAEIDQFGVGEFKSKFELTRKWAIPILEYLDSAGVTRRLGDRRQVVRSGS